MKVKLLVNGNFIVDETVQRGLRRGQEVDLRESYAIALADRGLVQLLEKPTPPPPKPATRRKKKADDSENTA